MLKYSAKMTLCCKGCPVDFDFDSTSSLKPEENIMENTENHKNE